MDKHNDQKLERWVDEKLERLTPDTKWEPGVPRGLARLREGREPRSSRRRWTMRVAAGATTMVLLLLPTSVVRAFARRCGEFVMRSLSGPSSSRSDARMTQRKAVPDFALNDAAGRPIALSSLRGKVVLLNFWTTSCAQCDAEMPWFTEFQQTYGSGDFAVLGVSLDKGGWALVTPYVESRKIGYPVVVGNDEIARLRGSRGATPTTLIIDKTGRIAVTHVGFCSKSEYEADIKRMLAEN